MALESEPKPTISLLQRGNETPLPGIEAIGRYTLEEITACLRNSPDTSLNVTWKTPGIIPRFEEGILEMAEDGSLVIRAADALNFDPKTLKLRGDAQDYVSGYTTTQTRLQKEREHDNAVTRLAAIAGDTSLAALSQKPPTQGPKAEEQAPEQHTDTETLTALNEIPAIAEALRAFQGTAKSITINAETGEVTVE